MGDNERRIKFRGPLTGRCHRVRDGYGRDLAVGVLIMLSLLYTAWLLRIGDYDRLMRGRRGSLSPAGQAAVFLILFTLALLDGRQLRRGYLGVGPLSGEVGGVLTDSGITWATDDGTQRYGWSEVTKVRFLRDAVRMRAKPEATLVLLQEFFDSERERTEAVDMIRAHTGARRS